MAALPLNHPGGSLAAGSRAAGDFVTRPSRVRRPRVREPLAEFAKGAAAIALDAHFTPEELPEHAGWGHSDWRQCAEFAAATGIGRLWLFHHKPGRSDQALDDIRVEAQKVFANTRTASEETFFDV
jgi:ribonuclease BN (tRNA processing enzyme)